MRGDKYRSINILAPPNEIVAIMDYASSYLADVAEHNRLEKEKKAREDRKRQERAKRTPSSASEDEEEAPAGNAEGRQRRPPAVEDDQRSVDREDI